jgi:hypothetical protein
MSMSGNDKHLSGGPTRHAIIRALSSSSMKEEILRRYDHYRLMA